MSEIEAMRYELGQDDGRYPRALLALDDAPETLYALGEPAALSRNGRPKIAIVGARRMTPYGERCAKLFGAVAARAGAAVVTGGARGIEAAAASAALEEDGECVAVLAGGLEDPWPASNGDLFQDIVWAGGALASEQPWDAQPLRYQFMKRNRLIAALADAILVVECGLPSGVFALAESAMQMGKPVWAVPGAIDAPMSAGPNELLCAGAKAITSESRFEAALREF